MHLFFNRLWGPERSGGIALFHKKRENTSIFHFEIRGGAPAQRSEERSNITQESSPRTWKLRSSMFCPQSSVFRPLKVGKVIEVEERSTITHKSSPRTMETRLTNVLSSVL
ncbi:hypothetical protein BES34_005005 [Leptospira inadai serovar Lyme]|uniref:Uncharacterized protein n=1 Tax=Leptospira inadai serovar Lyme TaxID=293084 RepID=A0ABX4YKU6_9LEPT|nr:hypothetical protein BES34_005005 [Leptospira inadai serovar Lyme]